MADISRADLASLIQDEYSNTFLQRATEGSVALQAFPTMPIGTSVANMPVLATLPTAGWVSETGTKPTSEVVWANKSFVVEELAVIIPIHENVLADATVDIVSSIVAEGGAAIGRALDAAVFFGTGKPASWTSPSLFESAVATGQTVALVDGVANSADMYGALMQAAGMVADTGLDPSTLLAGAPLRYRMANIRNAQGDLAFTGDQFAGFDTYFVRGGAWESADATLMVADPSRVRLAVRQDITVKLLTEATLSNGGSPINLAERDMVGFRFVARYAYVLSDHITTAGVPGGPVGAVTPDVTP